MTLAEARINVQNNLGNKGANTATIIDTALKYALKALSQRKDFPSLEGEKTISLTTGVISYPIISSPISITDMKEDNFYSVVYLKNNSTTAPPVEYVTPIIWDREILPLRDHEGEPYVYTIWGKTVKIYKIPDTTDQATTLTFAAGIVTATCAAHGYSDDDYITIAGANEADYNGTFQVAGVTTNTFTYTITGTPSSPATGTITSNKGYRLQIKYRKKATFPALAGDSFDPAEADEVIEAMATAYAFLALEVGESASAWFKIADKLAGEFFYSNAKMENFKPAGKLLGVSGEYYRDPFIKGVR